MTALERLQEGLLYLSWVPSVWDGLGTRGENAGRRGGLLLSDGSPHSWRLTDNFLRIQAGYGWIHSSECRTRSLGIQPSCCSSVPSCPGSGVNPCWFCACHLLQEASQTTVAGSVYVPLKARASAHTVSGSHSQLLFPLLVTLCSHV